ncbi:hypothetical protein AYI69_g6302 [Smittium culicis]|uniref:26S proteasome non-ATPase regulatory subunit 5 n=1 Tax=Smittium culicis TaxID=133412 RepID=A0A1R1XZY3_9FUNG|nr:hypothetical protein AYI69_g6302 [Smittium culicis]
MGDTSDYNDTIKQICELLQSGTTPEAIKQLAEQFDMLSSFLTNAPDNKLIVSVVNVTEKLLDPVTWDMIQEKFDFSNEYPSYIWACLKEPIDSELVQETSKALLSLSNYENFTEKLFDESSMEVIKSVLNMDASHRYLVYDIFINSIIQFEDSASFYEKESLISQIPLDISSNDPLIVLNALELIPKVFS